ncbi:hypothetical protein [Streptomyces antibioticus]|uniref:hypothetical protein n=1 Tax=Streptomyces antibioticus TaxID=1890 RepID=UPI0033F5C341
MSPVVHSAGRRPRIVHVLEIENSKLKETNAALQRQVAVQAPSPTSPAGGANPDPGVDAGR